MLSLNALCTCAKQQKLVDHTFREKRQGIYKVILPAYQEAGDLHDVFVMESPIDSEKFRILDFGLTYMKLSYIANLECESEDKRFCDTVIRNHCQTDDGGNIFVDVPPEGLGAGVAAVVQAENAVFSAYD